MPDPKSADSPAGQSVPSPQGAAKENDAIYQKGRLVARAAGAEIDAGAGVIRFAELFNSDELLLPDECEFREHRIVVKKIEYSTKVERTAAHKGRILQGVTAQIVPSAKP